MASGCGLQSNMEAVLDREEEGIMHQEALSKQLEQSRSQVAAMQSEVASASEFVQVGLPSNCGDHHDLCTAQNSQCTVTVLWTPWLKRLCFPTWLHLELYACPCA